jgi:hypothetical protein
VRWEGSGGVEEPSHVSRLIYLFYASYSDPLNQFQKPQT